MVGATEIIHTHRRVDRRPASSYRVLIVSRGQIPIGRGGVVAVASAEYDQHRWSDGDDSTRECAHGSWSDMACFVFLYPMKQGRSQKAMFKAPYLLSTLPNKLRASSYQI